MRIFIITKEERFKMANRIMLNQTSYHGSGAIEELVNEIRANGFKKAFVSTDPELIKFCVSSFLCILIIRISLNSLNIFIILLY